MRQQRKSSEIGFSGRFEAGTRIVDDPSVPGTKITANVNIRATVLDHLASRGKLNQAQRQAGERFLEIWRRASIGQLKAIEYKESVDGSGGGGDPLTEDLVRATLELKKIMPRVGMIGHRILVMIVGEGQTVSETARAWVEDGGIVAGARAEGYVTGRLLEALDELADMWGFTAVAIGRPNVRRISRVVVAAPIKDAVKATFGRRATLESAAKEARSFGSGARGHRFGVIDHTQGSGEITVTGPVTELRVIDRGTHSELVSIELPRPVDNAPLTEHGSSSAEKRARPRKR